MSGAVGDARGRSVVLVGACLLDQNLRFPGIAVESGPCSALVDRLMAAGAGIEVIPCLECAEWGGVGRRKVIRLLPILYRAAGTRWYPVLRLLSRFPLWMYGRACCSEARRVVKRVTGLSAAGCRAAGVVLMNDSPTCGVTRTLDLLEFVPEFKRRGHSLADLIHPEAGVLGEAVPALLRDGTGFLAAALGREFRRRGIELPLVGYDPWLPVVERAAEVERVVAGLEVGGGPGE